METNIYEFNQNNSGGEFDVDNKLCHRLFIEAKNPNEANAIALKMGVYFDGCDEGLDCPCCGDRWYETNDYDIVDLDRLSKGYHVEFKTVEEYAQHLADTFGWTSPDARIFYLNGEIKEIFKNKKDEN